MTNLKAKWDGITINRWRSPASEYPRARIGTAAIRTAWYPSGYYDAYRTNDLDYYFAAKRLYITILKIDGEIWMVDDPPHWWAMKEHAAAFEGHVICAGLGLGLMVHAMTGNPKITKITVIEKSQDVIDLVCPLVPHDKLEIINQDWFEINPDTVGRVDGVFFDLFVSDNGIECLGPAFGIAREAIERFGEHITFRVNGLPNPMVESVARAEIKLRKKIESAT